MATRSFKQLVYSRDGSIYNHPAALTKAQLIDGSAFLGMQSIIQLGVQAPPGTKFYVNNNSQPVIVGYTGLFDIDLSNGGSIINLRFNEQSLEIIEENDSNLLIIDMLYLGGE